VVPIPIRPNSLISSLYTIFEVPTPTPSPSASMDHYRITL
jgi:hypothetical protein